MLISLPAGFVGFQDRRSCGRQGMLLWRGLRQKQELARKEEALKAQLKDKGKGPAKGRGKGRK
jgi:hypothetical protein